MARRKKSSVAEHLIDLVAMLPPYAGVGLAIVGYLVLHSIAAAPMNTAYVPADRGAAMSRAIGHGLAFAGQFILPLLCLAGAAISAWRRHERRALAQSVTSSSAPDALEGMTWRQFEALVGEGFRLQGYSVHENFEAGPDGGVDLVLRKGAEKYLVQCKQWRAFKVGVPVVRELYGAMAAHGAAGGFVVTSGQFTAEAKAFAQGRNVQLIDGPQLQQLLRQAKAGGAGNRSAAVDTAKPMAPPGKASGIQPEPSTVNAAAPSCPKCSQAMVRRTARKGANAGREFWGCSDYPRCRGTA